MPVQCDEIAMAKSVPIKPFDSTQIIWDFLMVGVRPIQIQQPNSFTDLAVVPSDLGEVHVPSRRERLESRQRRAGRPGDALCRRDRDAAAGVVRRATERTNGAERVGARRSSARRIRSAPSFTAWTKAGKSAF